MIKTLVTTADWLIVLPVIVPLLCAAFGVIAWHRPVIQAVLGIAGLIVVTVISFMLLLQVLIYGPQAMTMGNWLPPYGISFTADLLSAIFAFTAAIVGLLVGIYAFADTSSSERRHGFYPLLLFLMTGVLGAFLTGDMFNLYVWFEVMLISSFGLIVLGGEPRQIDGAVKYTILNLIATTLFLIATGLLYGAVGTLNIADLYFKIAELQDLSVLSPIAVLYLIALGMKAAAFPLFFWLPASYHTPKIVVSALFAALLTKVGIYALVRIFLLVLPDNQGMTHDLLIWVAMATMLTGAIGALAQNDLRRILNFLVISGIGVMLFGLALNSDGAIAALVFYAVHSMLVMALLYMLAGIIGQKSGSFELSELGGLYRAAPLLSGLFLIALFAIAGLPPFTGFWAKFMMLKAGFGEQAYGGISVLLFTSFLNLIVIGRIFAQIFWRGGSAEDPDGAETLSPVTLAPGRQRILIIPCAVLTALVILISLMPSPLVSLSAGAEAMLFDPSGYINAVFGGGA